MYKISKFDIILFGSLILIIGTVYFLVTVVFAEEEPIIREFSIVDQYNTYFMVNDKINDLLLEISENNIAKVYSLLDTKYIENYNINYDNIYNYLKNYGADVSIDADEVIYTSIGKDLVYYVHGKIQREQYLEPKVIVDEDFSILMFLDTVNMTYSFYIIGNEDYHDIVNSIESFNIPKNKYNVYNGANMITTEMICSIYLTKYIETLVTDINTSFDMLNSSFQNEKFANIEEYKNYINNNIDKFSPIADKCAVTGTEQKIYAIYDQNQNYYEFLEDEIMKFYVKFELNEE